MSQSVEALAANPDGLSSVPRIDLYGQRIEPTPESCPMTSAQALRHLYPHTNENLKSKSEWR